jgi:ubiquinone/menaquinone biosynthesis C-methylase UbiE
MTDEDRIRTTYDGYEAAGRSHLWDRTNPGYARLAHERDDHVVSLIRRSSSESASVLDVGCGTGHAVALVRQAEGGRYTGIDLLPGRIAAAQAAEPDTRFLVGSADAMPFDDGLFDIALALTLFSSLPSKELEHRVAHEIGRVLRPHGWLIWYDLRFGNPSNHAVHGLSKARIRELFPHWRAELETLTLLPPLARRLGVTTPIAYPMLHAIPPLRSHLVGRLQAPG